MLNRKMRKEDLMTLPKETIVNMLLDLQEDSEDLGNALICSNLEKKCDELCQCKKDKLCNPKYL